MTVCNTRPKIYRTKPKYVEAFRYGPEFYYGIVKELAEFVAGGSNLSVDQTVDYVRPESTFNEDFALRVKVDFKNNIWDSLPFGFYVVRSYRDYGGYFVMDPKTFEERYEQADGSLQ